MWLVEVLVGHGVGERIGWWDAVASGNAARDANSGEGDLAGEWVVESERQGNGWQGNAGKERG